jgi:hypothetical protein
LSTNKMCGVCVWSVIILTPLSARAEAVINLPSQISIV